MRGMANVHGTYPSDIGPSGTSKEINREQVINLLNQFGGDDLIDGRDNRDDVLNVDNDSILINKGYRFLYVDEKDVFFIYHHDGKYYLRSIDSTLLQRHVLNSRRMFRHHSKLDEWCVANGIVEAEA